MKWKDLSIAYLALFTLGFIDNARGPLYPEIINNLQISVSKASLIFTIASFAGTLSNYFSKYWLPFLGAINSTRIFGSVLLLSTLLLGISHNLSMLLFSSFLYGLTLGGIGISMNVLVTQSSTSQLRRKSLSGLHSTYALASIFSPLLVSYLLRKNVEWNQIFLYFSILSALSLLWSLSGLTRNDINKKINTDDIKILKIQKTKFIKLNIHEKFFSTFIIAPYVGAEILISSRFPLFLQTEYKYTASLASNYLSLFFICLLAGRVLFSIIHVEYKISFILKISLITSIIFLTIGIFYNPIFISLTGLSMSLFFPFALDFFTKKYPSKISEITAWSLFTVGILLMFTHSIFSFIFTSFGIIIAFSLAIVFLLISLLTLYKLDR